MTGFLLLMRNNFQEFSHFSTGGCQKAWRRLLGMNASAFRDERLSFPYFLLLQYWPNYFLTIAKTQKNVTCNLSGFFSQKKGLSGRSSKTARPKNYEKMFCGHLTRKCSIKCSGFVAVMFDFGEISRRPSKPSSSHPKNNFFFGLRVMFLATNWIFQDKNFSVLRFLIWYPKTSFENVLVEPFGMSVPKRSFSGIKIREVACDFCWVQPI